MKKPTAEMVRKWIDEAVAEWVGAEATQEAVTSRVREILGQHRDKVIAKALGFQDSWGRWEVDHCNGREPKISEIIRPLAERAAEKWINEELLTKPPATKPAMKKAAIEEYKDHLHRGLKEGAQRAARAHLPAMLNALLREAGLEAEAEEEL